MGAPAPAPGRVEITDTAHVELLVRRFYQAVIPDPLLGPIFRAMDVDWSVHIPKLVAFWAGRLLGQRGYEGNVVGAHQPVLDRSLLMRQPPAAGPSTDEPLDHEVAQHETRQCGGVAGPPAGLAEDLPATCRSPDPGPGSR